MARGGRGYAAVPAGDDHIPRRADGRRVDADDEAADADHDRTQLTSGVARSDQVESDSDSEEEAATQQRESAAPSAAATPATVTTTASAGAAMVATETERPQEERVDRKVVEAGHRDNNSNNNDNNNQHTESASSTAEASSDSSSAASAGSPAEEEGDAAEEEPLPPGAIRIRILDLNGKFFSIACQLDWRVARLKDKVHEAADVAVAAQRLIYRGRVLEDDKVLDDYKLEDGHTVHLFVRMNATPEPEPAAADAATSGAAAPTLSRFGDDGVTIVHITSETISSAVFPSDSARRVDPLMLDSPLGNCARRVKLWSSFLLIIYTMKVMGQFALLANDQQMRQEQNSAKDDSNGQDRYYDRYDYPPYYNQDPMVSALELMVHAFGVYVGCVGFKAAHDTDIRPIRFYCRGIVWLAFLTVLEQMYVTYQISQSDYPETRIQYPYGPAAPSKDDIISANVFQTIMLVVMWIIAIAHSYAHQAEVARYNESFAAAAMNAVPPAHLPENVV